MKKWRIRVRDEEDLYFIHNGWNKEDLLIVKEKAQEFILDEYEAKIEELQKENEDLKYEVRRLIDGHPSKEGYKMMSRIMENNYKLEEDK